jgi:hypothetical protein
MTSPGYIKSISGTLLFCISLLTPGPGVTQTFDTYLDENFLHPYYGYNNIEYIDPLSDSELFNQNDHSYDTHTEHCNEDSTPYFDSSDNICKSIRLCYGEVFTVILDDSYCNILANAPIFPFSNPSEITYTHDFVTDSRTITISSEFVNGCLFNGECTIKNNEVEISCTISHPEIGSLMCTGTFFENEATFTFTLEFGEGMVISYELTLPAPQVFLEQIDNALNNFAEPASHIGIGTSVNINPYTQERDEGSMGIIGIELKH